MLKLALSGALLMASPANATCHHYSYWAYPTPQRCSPVALPERKTWFVEIKPESDPPSSGADQRTDEQRQDEADHDRAVAEHKEDLNRQLRQLTEPAIGVR